MSDRFPITISPSIQGGTPVFSGTRVPVDILFEYLEGDETLESFLEQYPSVSRQQVIDVLEAARRGLVSTGA